MSGFIIPTILSPSPSSISVSVADKLFVTILSGALSNVCLTSLPDASYVVIVTGYCVCFDSACNCELLLLSLEPVFPQPVNNAADVTVIAKTVISDLNFLIASSLLYYTFIFFDMSVKSNSSTHDVSKSESCCSSLSACHKSCVLN